MSLTPTLRALRRKLSPPGNRGSLDSAYRQPNGDAGQFAGGIGRDADLPTHGSTQKRPI